MLKKLKSTDVLHSRSGDTRNAKVINVNKDKVYLSWNYYCLKDKEDKVANFLENFLIILVTLFIKEILNRSSLKAVML